MSVWEKLAAGLYKNQDVYPDCPKKPVLAKNATPAEHRTYADELEKYEALLASYKQACAAYNTRTSELEAEFQTDLEAYYEMSGHPKSGLLYWKAYERGHSGGMEEVANVYSDLVELVK